MANTGKYVFSNHTGEPKAEAKQFSPTARQHVLLEFFRREREADNGPEEDAAPDAPATTTKESRRRNRNTRQAVSRLHPKRSSVKRSSRARKDNPQLHRQSTSTELAVLQELPEGSHLSHTWASNLDDTVGSSPPGLTDSVSHPDTSSSLPSVTQSDLPPGVFETALPQFTSPFEPNFVPTLNPQAELDLILASIGIVATEHESTDEATQQFAQPICPSDCDCSTSLSDAESRTSSERSIKDLDDLDDNYLGLEVSKLRSWLLVRSEDPLCFQELQSQVTYRQHNSSAPQCQSVEQSSKSAASSSSSSPSNSSSAQTDSSGGTSSNSKRRREDPDENDEQQTSKRRISPHKVNVTAAPRLACFYNKFDPLTYRSSTQTGKKFEICETHDFKDIGYLFEHLQRRHSGQAVQCPRCTRTDFLTSEELLAHQIASEPCVRVSPTVKRIQWISDDRRNALRKEVARELRGRSDEEKWKYTYKRLFQVSDENVPSPFFEDPVISIVSFVVDHYEMRLRSEMRHSNDLLDLESRIPTIFGYFLAQYGINVNAMDNNPGQDHTNTLPSSSGNLNLSPEDSSALVAPQASFENVDWPQHNTIPYFGDLFPIGSEQDSRSIENTLTNFTEFEMHPVEGTSASYSYGIV